jgi:DNA-binding response OmpR family regulator
MKPSASNLPETSKEVAMHRVLIIEDDDYVLKMLEQTFLKAGYSVSLAPNGAVGVKLFEQRKKSNEPFHVVITDLIMPEMEGIETITTLRKKNPEVQIIAISGGGRNRPEDYLLLAGRLGAVRTFTKPVDRKALLHAVSEIIAHQPA